MSEGASNTHSARSRQIAETLARHGLGYLVGVLGLEHLVPFHRGFLGHPRRVEPYTRPEHVRMALEELGVTFMKLGQILSTRSDLLPPEYQVELAKLQDAAPPVPLAEIRERLTAELGRPPEGVFSSFESTPLAAASIGQVHAATLPDGTEVVVKVRRPGAVAQVEADLTILQNLALRANRRWDLAKQYDLVGLVQEFGQDLRHELDYVREGRNAERFAANFVGVTDVRIPRVFWQISTTSVLSLERIRGTKISDVGALARAGLDRKVLAVRSSRILLKMVFEDGLFHADPHPGNFFVQSDGRIGIIDFGLVGIVDEPTREHLVDLLLAISSQDPERLSDAFLDLGMARTHVDRDLLQRDLQRLVGRYYGQPLRDIAIGPLVEDGLAIARRHRLQLPTGFALLLKTVLMSEGMGMLLDPEFQLTSVLTPFAQRLLMRRLSPPQWASRAGGAGMDAARLGIELPRRLRRILGDVERGTLAIGVRPTDTERLVAHAECLVNRLVLGMLDAALIVGLASLMAVYHPAGGTAWLGLFFAIGFVLAVLLAVYLFWTVHRARRS